MKTVTRTILHDEGWIIKCESTIISKDLSFREQIDGFSQKFRLYKKMWGDAWVEVGNGFKYVGQARAVITEWERPSIIAVPLERGFKLKGEYYEQ